MWAGYHHKIAVYFNVTASQKIYFTFIMLLTAVLDCYAYIFHSVSAAGCIVCFPCLPAVTSGRFSCDLSGSACGLAYI